jgi:hypothetical protein
VGYPSLLAAMRCFPDVWATGSNFCFGSILPVQAKATAGRGYVKTKKA